MVSCQDLQLEYNDLYIQMRKYIWDFRVVEALADLELACYDACVDLDEVKNCFYALQKLVIHVMNEDEEFKEQFDTFDKFLQDIKEIYTPLYKVNEEGPSYEDIKEDEEQFPAREGFRRRISR